MDLPPIVLIDHWLAMGDDDDDDDDAHHNDGGGLFITTIWDGSSHPRHQGRHIQTTPLPI